MTETEQELEATYGPRAPFSEHKRGDRVRYLGTDGNEASGEIIWVAAPGMLAHQYMELRYIVAPDPPDDAFFAVVFPQDVIHDATGEPRLADCPYCQGKHEPHLIEQCPLKPNR